jgi:uncharacterized protein (TIGR00290 family)
MTEDRSFINWSGGKDATMALYRAMNNKVVTPDLLLTHLNEAHQRISMHGVRRELMELQSEALGLAIEYVGLPEQPTMQDYERAVAEKMDQLKSRGYRNILFGDIFLEDLKAYREAQYGALGMHCVFPLWKENSRTLVEEFIALGFKAHVVAVDSTRLDQQFCGRLIDAAFLNDLPDGVDPCGENGEYHSFVVDGPLFRHPVPYQLGEKVYREYPAAKRKEDECFTAPLPPAGFWFCDLLPG